MINAEKYLKDGVDIEKMAEEMVDLWNFPPCEGICPADIVDYFNMKTKPQLTEDERIILRSIDIKAFKTIGRRKSGGLYVRFIFQDETYNASIFNDNLFQFIKER